MSAPRLDFAAIGTNPNADALESALIKAGHRVHWPVDWHDVPNYSAVLLRVAADDLPDVVSRLEHHVSTSQIIIHTALEVGAAQLIDLPAVGIAMHRLGNGDTIVETNDDIAATVASVLISELHGNPVEIPTDERPALAEALELLNQARELRYKALGSVQSEVAQDLIDRLGEVY